MTHKLLYSTALLLIHLLFSKITTPLLYALCVFFSPNSISFHPSVLQFPNSSMISCYHLLPKYVIPSFLTSAFLVSFPLLPQRMPPCAEAWARDVVWGVLWELLPRMPHPDLNSELCNSELCKRCCSHALRAQAGGCMQLSPATAFADGVAGLGCLHPPRSGCSHHA